MTMLDDDRLASVLTEAAQSFDVPADGPTAIIARARSIRAEASATTAVTAPTGARPDAEGGDDERDDVGRPGRPCRPAAACDGSGTPAPARDGGRLRRRAAGRAGRGGRADTPDVPAVDLEPGAAARATCERTPLAPSPTPPAAGNTSLRPQFKTAGPTSSAGGAVSGAPLGRAGSGTTSAAAPPARSCRAAPWGGPAGSSSRARSGSGSAAGP